MRLGCSTEYGSAHDRCSAAYPGCGSTAGFRVDPNLRGIGQGLTSPVPYHECKNDACRTPVDFAPPESDGVLTAYVLDRIEEN